MRILAIETSCDETAAAVIEGTSRNEGHPRIRSNIIASQAKKHNQFGGVVPEVAAREHVSVILPTIELALKKAGAKFHQIDYIAVTQGPGLITSLMVGVDTAKTLGAVLDIPVIPVNHLEGHIYANFVREFPISNFQFPKFPALILIVSGGHTLLVLMRGHGQFKILGETLDDAAGECFDKSAKLLGLGYPGGPALSKLAKRGNPKSFNLPRPMIHSKDLNFSFSGLKTAVLHTVSKIARTSKKVDKKTKQDVAAAIQQAIVDVLIAKTEQAIQKYHPRTLMLGGGVAANDLLRRRFRQLATTSNLQPSTPAVEYCTDNAAMIGLSVYFKIKSNRGVGSKNFSASPDLPLS